MQHMLYNKDCFLGSDGTWLKTIDGAQTARATYRALDFSPVAIDTLLVSEKHTREISLEISTTSAVIQHHSEKQGHAPGAHIY